jgi:undecaprenyl-diphosphatase
MDYIHQLVKATESFGVWGYVLAFSLAFLESLAIVGGFIPGSTAIVLLGFMCARGYLNIYVLMSVTVLGAILGDSASYWLGSKGTHLFKQENRFLKARHLDMGQKFFDRHGNKSIFLGRFIGIIRPMIPFAAGLSRMNYKVFVFWNVLSGIIWGVSHIYIGYFFGSAFKLIEAWSARISVILVILVAVGVLFWLMAKAFSPSVLFIGRTVQSYTDIFLGTTWVQKLINRYPSVSVFIIRRFEKRVFSGWPLTLMAVTASAFIVLFIFLANWILDADPVTRFDDRVALFLLFFRDASLVRISLWISLLCKFQIVMLAALSLISSMLIWNRRHMIWPFIAMLTVCEGIVLIMRENLMRSRPAGVIPAYFDKTYTFPSEYSALAVLLYGFIAYFIVHILLKGRPRLSIWTIFVTLLLVTLIGFSQLYLGINYFSDVLGGYLIGGICLLTGIGIFEWVLQRGRGGKNPYFLMENGQKRILTYLFISAPILFFIFYGTYIYKPEKIRGREMESNRVLTSKISPQGIFSFNKWPTQTVGLTGRKHEPISYMVWAKNDRKFQDAFIKGGWKIPDQPSARNFFRMAFFAAGGRYYDSAPITPVFWLNDTNDFAFEKITENTRPKRHCVRFWKTDLIDADGNALYLGASGKTEGRRSLDIASERKMVIGDLNSTGLVNYAANEIMRVPESANNTFTVRYFTDGMVSVLILK